MIGLQVRGLSYDEIAAQTGDSRRTVERQILRARDKLARRAERAPGVNNPIATGSIEHDARPLPGPGRRVRRSNHATRLSPELEARDVDDVDRRRVQTVCEWALLVRELTGCEPGRLPRDQPR